MMKAPYQTAQSEYDGVASYDDDDDDDIYIMVKCLSVCNEKAPHSVFKRFWSFLLFLDTFRIQKCLETVK